MTHSGEDLLAPAVLLEPCVVYTADSEAAVRSCSRCGWLEDDHVAAARTALAAALPHLAPGAQRAGRIRAAS